MGVVWGRMGVQGPWCKMQKKSLQARRGDGSSGGWRGFRSCVFLWDLLDLSGGEGAKAAVFGHWETLNSFMSSVIPYTCFQCCVGKVGINRQYLKKLSLRIFINYSPPSPLFLLPSLSRLLILFFTHSPSPPALLLLPPPPLCPPPSLPLSSSLLNI